MSLVLALNLILALLVIAAIVGGLAWSVASQNLGAPAGLLRTARRRQRTTARPQFIGRPADHRA
jgi:hypothetical protein